MTGWNQKISGVSVTERATVPSLETLKGKKTIMTVQNCKKTRNGEKKKLNKEILFLSSSYEKMN